MLNLDQFLLKEIAETSISHCFGKLSEAELLRIVSGNT